MPSGVPLPGVVLRYYQTRSRYWALWYSSVMKVDLQTTSLGGYLPKLGERSPRVRDTGASLCLATPSTLVGRVGETEN